MTRQLILSASVCEPSFNDPAWAANVLHLAEAAGLDLLLIGRSGACPFDPQVLAAWAASRTSTIGIVPCVSTRTDHPFHTARSMSAIDFLSRGRTGWNPVVGAGDPAEKAADMVTAARSLWDGWDADALIIDKQSGRYLDGSKVRLSNHAGPFYTVRGPLNAARPPQGHPLLIVDAASPFAVDDIDIAIVDAGSAISAARKVLRVAPDVDADLIARRLVSGEIDGMHFDLSDAVNELPAIALRFGGERSERPSHGTLRERLGLPAPAQITTARIAA